MVAFSCASLEWQIVHPACTIPMSLSIDVLVIMEYLLGFGMYISSALCLSVVTFSEKVGALVG
jgi:hypothetical protein